MPKINLTRRQFLKASGASLFLAGIPLPGFTKDKPPGTISVILLEGWNGWSSSGSTIW
jgi:hypothetical protein